MANITLEPSRQPRRTASPQAREDVASLPDSGGGVLGIDPGVGGAVALFDPGKSPASGLRWIVEDMPLVGRELNPAKLRDWLRQFSPKECLLEIATTHPRDGRVGAFRYGGMWYGIRAVLACCDVSYEKVAPTRWKEFYRLKGTDKEASRRLALELFPDAAGLLSRKKDHGRAEAMLIAYYGARGRS
jgi:crossover junction endodeoxyribonuclease RuvC